MEMIIFYISLSLAVIFLAAAVVLLRLCLRAKHISREKEKSLAENMEEIEKQKKIIKNLSNLYDTTIQYDKEITDFFTNIIHELKTPISVILGAIQLLDLKLENLPEEQARYSKTFQIIKHNCYRLLRLTNNLLDFARLDSGYLKLNPVNCNIVSLTEEITQSVMPYARQKRIDLVFEARHEEISTAIDMEKIERVLLNLLSNAIKFTGQGGKVLVAVRSLENKVLITVKDTGIGIPREKQKEIFERFRQVGSNQSRDQEGCGIGLSLVKSFVDLHQGSITLTSEEHKGSEFVVELPIRKLETHEIKGEEPLISDLHHKLNEAINIEFSSSIAS